MTDAGEREEEMDGTTSVTFRYRVRDKHASVLNEQARAVNLVWNYCNEIQQKAARSLRPWLSGYALARLVSGCTKAGLPVHAHTAMLTCHQYARSRKAANKAWLRWRSKRSLGWVPFNTGHVRLRGGAFVFNGRRYEVWMHRPLPAGAEPRAGSFNQDSLGRWYLNLVVRYPHLAEAPAGDVGIDLGLKDLATLSTGERVESARFGRRTEVRLVAAQRAKKLRLARALANKVRNQRRDHLHKASTQIATKFGLIVVGDVSPSKLAKTGMAKSVLDAGWSDFRAMLSYKALRHGGRYVEVPEAMTTQTCSECGSLPPSRPRGIAGLRIREWACDECGTVHDRDVNAARNILRLGQQALVEGAMA